MNLHVSIKGGPELARKLGRLSDAAAGDALEQALTAGALLVRDDAQEKAPYRTGTLRKSIHTETREKTRTQVTVVVGTDVPYARRQELGFSGIDSLGRKYNQPARPYLRPALDENKGAVAREVGEALRDLLRRVR
jgi:HK97 gp10 family phage protein